MPTTLQAQNNETPDPTQALSSAVTNNTNTGHDNTTSSVTIGSEESNSETKTCRWFSFLSMQARLVKVQFSWSLSGSLTLTAAAPGTSQADAEFVVEYSTDNGFNWNTALTRSFSLNTNGTTPLSDSGSVNLEIPSFNPSMVQVRDKIRAAASSAADPTVSASASITAELNTLQIEVIPHGGVMCGM